MKKLLMLSACIFASYAMQAQCGGCPNHKQVNCTKATPTVKPDSTQKLIAVPANNKQIRPIESSDVRQVPTVRIKEMPKKEESSNTVPLKETPKATTTSDEKNKK